MPSPEGKTLQSLIESKPRWVTAVAKDKHEDTNFSELQRAGRR